MYDGGAAALRRDAASGSPTGLGLDAGGTRPKAAVVMVTAGLFGCVATPAVRHLSTRKPIQEKFGESGTKARFGQCKEDSFLLVLR